MNDIISIVINLDSRPGSREGKSAISSGTVHGTLSMDYFTDGVLNKIRFFENAGFDLEVLLFMDIHENLPEDLLAALLKSHKDGQINDLIFHRHTENFITRIYPKWLDLCILNGIISARGKYVAHFDQDMAAFIQDKSVIKEWVGWLEEDKYDYISYPSRWSPRPVNDPDFDYNWASSRFFFCKRDILDYSEMLKCLRSNEYLYGKYGEKKRKTPWLEHVMGIIAGPGKVFYPPIEPGRYLLFSWGQYCSGILKKLNEMPYEKVAEYVRRCGGIAYPCDVRGREI